VIDRFAATDAGTLAISACIALVAAWVGTAMARRAAYAIGMVSQPNPIVPQHTRSTAYLGGVGVALGIGAATIVTSLIVGSTAAGSSTRQSEAILGGAAAFFVLGILDDRRAFGAATKFALQAIIAAVVVWLGVCAPVCGVLFIDCLASWFWICMLVNAFNFVDVSDGLLASVSICVFAALAVAFPPVTTLAVPAAAACIGFLPRNHPPATIFLGDAGSHLLGFLAAALTIVGVGGCSSPVAGVVVSSIILVVPLFELCFITVARVRKGLPWWKGSPDHFALRMQAEGFTRLQVNAIAVGATCLASFIAIAALALSNHFVFVAAMFVLFAVVPCWRRLDVMGQCTK
jgi:UDP-GlcNAc:undecaprenyl-phosphate GlcNAc-1-phosphate transferase